MSRRGSRVFVSSTRYLNVEGIAELQAKIAALPDALVAKVKPALERGGDLLAEKVRAIAPESELEPHAGHMKDHVVREPGRDELSVVVAVDAVDDRGRQYPPHVEYGHKARDGSHVPAEPFFWPAYHVSKKTIIAGVSRAVTSGIKVVFGGAK